MNEAIEKKTTGADWGSFFSSLTAQAWRIFHIVPPFLNEVTTDAKPRIDGLSHNVIRLRLDIVCNGLLMFELLGAEICSQAPRLLALPPFHHCIQQYFLVRYIAPMLSVVVRFLEGG